MSEAEQQLEAPEPQGEEDYSSGEDPLLESDGEEEGDFPGGVQVADRGEEEEREEEGEEEDEGPRVFGPFDPARNDLSDGMKDWALEIKAAMQQSPEVDCPNDFWIAQWAIIETNLACVIRRAQQMQLFRETYDIVDTFEFGSKCLGDVVALFPGLYLNFSFNNLNGNYAIIEDMAKFEFSAFQDPVKNKIWLRGCYFLNQILCCDLEAIRCGIVLIHEFEGFDWKKNIDLKALRQVWTELSIDYPIRFQNVLNYHCGVFANLIWSMAKPFMPREIRDKWIMGLWMEGRLDMIYNVPDIKAAQQRVLGRMRAALRRRYDNEASFQLA